MVLFRGPGQRIRGRNVFNDKRAFFRPAAAVVHEFAQLDRRREVVAVSVLKCAESAALLHKLVDLQHDLVAHLVWQRDERQAANDVTYLPDARAFVYGGGINSITADDLHLGEIAPQEPDKIAVEFDPEIRFIIRNDLLQKPRDRAGSDAKFQDGVVFVGLNALDHFLCKLRRARFYGTDLAGIL